MRSAEYRITRAGFVMGFVDLIVQLSVRNGLVGVEIFRIEVSLVLDQEYEMNEWMDGC